MSVGTSCRDGTGSKVREDLTRSVNEIKFWCCALATGQASPFKDLLKREKPLFFVCSFEKEMVSKWKNGSWIKMKKQKTESFGSHSLPWELIYKNALTVTVAPYQVSDF